MKQAINDEIVSFGLQKVRVVEYDITDSTSTRAKLFAESEAAEDKTPAIFVSRAQSAGRGTRGRSFESPGDGGLYISLLIYPDLSITEAPSLTALAAVALCRALESFIGEGVVGIKWVNDVYAGGKKLAGILTEGAADVCGRLRYAVIGIGVNLADAEHSDEVQAIMTSAERLGVKIEARELARALCREIFELLPTVCSKEIAKEYERRSIVIGEQIEIHTPEGIFLERAIGLDERLALITEDGDGKIKKYVSGDVSIRPRKEHKCHLE